MAKEIPITWETTESGCITPTSHALNQDGYFRKWIPSLKRMKMYHVHTWENLFGEIPEGFEINHKCKNRACSNPDHLECICGSKHAILTNEERYKPRKLEAEVYWRKTGCTGVHLSKVFGVSFSSSCKWIRSWR